MLTDPNPGRATPLGGRTYPEGAAGTRLPSGIILSGDDAGAFTRAGYHTLPMHVQCSAKIVSYEQTVDRTRSYVVAIDCNGQSWEYVAALVGHPLDESRPATGIYAGAESPALVGYVLGDYIDYVHGILSRGLPGFGCMAVMSLR